LLDSRLRHSGEIVVEPQSETISPGPLQTVPAMKPATITKVATLGRVVATLAGNTEPVSAVAFSPDGSRILTGSGDKTARLWDAATGEPVATLAGHTAAIHSVAFSPDGSRILTGSGDKTARLWLAHKLI
jgi:WD40 repeat protein